MKAFDTDVLVEVLAGNPVYVQRAAAIPTDEQAVPVIVMEEILRGVCTQSDRRRQASLE